MDDADQFILADSVSAAAEEPPRRRGIFRRRRPPKLPEEPLTHCENCKAPLTGEFCSKCGQHAIDYRRSLWRVLIDAADSFFNWDTKFLKSIGLLLIRPWQLTNDFNAGRRARYVHPLRLYLMASIAFFLLARTINLESKGLLDLTTEDRTDFSASLAKLTGPDSVLPQEQRDKVEAARVKLVQANGALTEQEQDEVKAAFKTVVKSNLKKHFSSEEREKVREALKRIPKAPEPPEAPAVVIPPVLGQSTDVPSPPEVSTPSPTAKPKVKEHNGLHFGNDDDDLGKTPFGRWIEGRIKDKIGEDGTKTRLFLETLRSNVPGMMLVCIPLFAFVLKVLYFMKKRYYVEHLVYALHVHAFLYVAVIVTSLLVMGTNRWLPGISGLIIGIFSCATVVLIFVSIRKVYKQGWLFSLFKFLLGGIIYCVILILGVATTAFVTLLLP